ncbi:TIM44-like domain-containing protein [Miltoncostaea marina]|uniref:TIM44-like domain-containing protein n=1 Tax=Miltoncostaea marina TaxID=2843215 RepID=UPI001C3D5164|nr:TIM44-like domain-containing protein [Miltoncostaea marina]
MAPRRPCSPRSGLRAPLAALLTLALSAPAALGAAGGGSGGFGGGGGGGFGGGGGGSGGGAEFGLGGYLVAGGAFAVLLLVGAVQERRTKTWSRAYARTRDRATAARRRARREDVERRSLVAAEDDPVFAADRVRAEAAALFAAVQAAWDRDDRDALAAMVGADLMAEWRLRLEDFAAKGWRNRVGVREHEVEYVGITNRAGQAEDRVVVRVSAELDDVVVDRAGRRIPHTGNPAGETHLREYWTLGRRDGRWVLLSIEQDAEGEHHLAAPIEADPSEDRRMTDRERVAAAVADAVPAGVGHADLDDEGARSALARARDLSLVDQRFDPDVIEATVRRGVAAWAEAVDGDDAAFARIARPGLLTDLLHPTAPAPDGRLVVRAPEVLSVTLVDVDADAVPPTVAVRMRIEGVRYIEDRATLTLIAGSRDRRVRFDGTWTLALDGPDDAPWRIAAVREAPPRGDGPAA